MELFKSISTNLFGAPILLSSLQREAFMTKHLVVVAGNIGAGKTSLAERIGRPTALAFDLSDPVIAERRQQLAVERQAALDRRHDQVDVVDAARTH